MGEREQEQDWKQVEKGSIGGGESSASGSFPFDKLRVRMTAKNGQRQEQPQVLRLRRSQKRERLRSG
jgi:hypothetical protein